MKTLIKTCLIALIVFSAFVTQAQVAVSNDGSSADASAMLDVKSTDKGVLVPRLTLSQRNTIASPATGLIIYQTDNMVGFYYYDGSTWERLVTESEASSDGDWSILGNNMYSAVSGNIGIGFSNPLNKLDVSGGDINTSGVFKIGNSTILSIKGSGSTYVGEYSGAHISSSSKNTFIGSGSGYYTTNGASNTIIGFRSGYKNENGSYNTYLGYYTGYNNIEGGRNTFLGHQAGKSNLGSDNVFIGYKTGYYETGSGKLFIDNSNTSDPLIWGDFDANRIVINGNAGDNSSNLTFFVNGRGGGDYAWNNTSDKKVKKNIQTIQNALSKVLNMRGVNFEWKDSNMESGIQMGFIAQEAVEIIPEVINQNGELYSMQYSPITALLTEAIKEQQKQIEELQKQIEVLQSISK